MKSLKKIILVIAILSIIPFGCAKEVQKDIVADVNGEIITLNKFNSLLEVYRKDKLSPEHKKKFLEKVIDDELLAQEAKKQGLFDDLKIRAQVENYQRQLLARELKNRIFQEKMTEDRLREYYNKNKDRYTKEKVEVSHIFIKILNKRDKDQVSRAEEKAKIVYERALLGEDFSQLAREFSDDLTTKDRGGHLGWIEKGKFSREFFNKALSMKKDEISEPVHSRLGFHIVKVIEEAKKFTQDFDEVKSSIKYNLRKELQEELLSDLRQKSMVIIKEDMLGIKRQEGKLKRKEEVGERREKPGKD